MGEKTQVALKPTVDILRREWWG